MCFLLLSEYFVVVRTLNAGLAPSSSRQRTAAVQRLAAAMCRAVPKSKSLQVASTSETRQTRKRHLAVNLCLSKCGTVPSCSVRLAHLPTVTPAVPHGWGEERQSRQRNEGRSCLSSDCAGMGLLPKIRVSEQNLLHFRHRLKETQHKMRKAFNRRVLFISKTVCNIAI